MSYKKVLKTLKKSEKLEKGSLQRRHKFNPLSPENKKITEQQRKWTHDEQGEGKEVYTEGNARLRALNKLHGMTKVKRHPKTGERMFLMHRGDMLEHDYFKDKDEIDYSEEFDSGYVSSWTPHHHVARDFGDVISAWIPESDLQHSSNQFNTSLKENRGSGKMGADGRSSTEKDEAEWLVHHKSKYIPANIKDTEKPNLNTRINARTKKLAASEKDVLIKKEDLKTPSSSVKLNPEHGKNIADAYEQMPHDPSHPAVQKAYGALINETKKQFNDMMQSGIKISRIQPGQENPYKNSKELHHDIKNNNHLHFFPTDQGFGSDDSDKSDHPMMQGTGIMHEGKELLANDLFRIVHDYYGHHKGGESGFGPKGEHRAYNTHKKMFSPEAQKALATETLGQNSWVNFGPHGEHNRTNPHKTKYAEQKAGLLPDHIISGNWHSSEE